MIKIRKFGLVIIVFKYYLSSMRRRSNFFLCRRKVLINLSIFFVILSQIVTIFLVGKSTFTGGNSRGAVGNEIRRWEFEGRMW